MTNDSPIPGFWKYRYFQTMKLVFLFSEEEKSVSLLGSFLAVHTAALLYATYNRRKLFFIIENN